MCWIYKHLRTEYIDGITQTRSSIDMHASPDQPDCSPIQSNHSSVPCFPRFARIKSRYNQSMYVMRWTPLLMKR
ncbi:hypothetical protein BDW42DRAFT_173284 [Aspergillus taichungensis]|uniref:Uncharacterized protein n=1 Tax=Aspergillus taichungensis TaxID=482145 RepID=A0A2J5HPY2_9EURO|nr:hypothetical protein BDW42DRAFT_173284 [Aspergillus taichungensis]